MEQGTVVDGAIGAPVVAGVGVAVEAVLRRLLHADSVVQVLEAFPGLTRQGFDAAVRYAAASVRGELVHGLGAVRVTVVDSEAAYEQARNEFERSTQLRDGLHDLAAGRLTPHAEVIAELRAMLPA